MLGDETERQTVGEQWVAEELSLRPTAPPATLPGYRLEFFLGAGTFGEVWFGHDLNTGRPVAIKFYLHRGGVNWSLLSREVKNLVQLSAERSIVQVLEVGWESEPPFYVMEYLPNGSLEDWLQTTECLPVGQAVEMFRKICLALNRCHGRGVLHCDLKPGNILLDSDHGPRLADFGQSRMSHDQSPSLGTLFYMAPEQAQLEAAPDARWDVYALGVILYRMLTGQVPHRDPSLLQRIDTAGSLSQRLEHYREAILGDERPRAHRERRGVDKDLAAIIDRCLAPEAGQRFANVQQVLDALDQRDQARARRPLMLLGIVGPLLLMLATGGFAARSIRSASVRATEALRTEARASNQLAARFAARSLENELSRYFQVLAREATDANTLRVLDQLLASAEASEIRKRIADLPGETHPDRPAFLRLPERRRLDAQLKARLAGYLGGVNSGLPGISTMFITDAQGTIISIALDTEVDEAQLSTGFNFAYRSYFHGGRDDFATGPQPTAVTPTTRPHLSPAFQSTATGRWKIAFSTPIFLTDDAAAGTRSAAATGAEGGAGTNREPDGVFVITTDLGDFESMRDGQLSDQLAVVIEARQGPLRGTVLQHPLLDQPSREGNSLAGKRFQLASGVLDRLLAGGDVDYLDPMARAPGGRAYQGVWLAAVAPVTLPREIGDDQPRLPASDTAPTQSAETDLLLLVQYRLSKVFEPVGDLQRQLMIEGATLLAILFAVTVGMWWYVNRITEHSRAEGPSGPPPPSGSDQPTIGIR